MRAILHSEEIRRLERLHADVSPPLMARAGRAAANHALEILGGRGGSVLVVVGPGNNGGDGYVVARVLRDAGCEVVVASGEQLPVLPPDAEAARADWRAAGGQDVVDFVGAQWALVVDALYGIGLSRPIEGRHGEWIARINAMRCPILALDIPSGLNGNTGAAMGDAIRATHTATFIALKPGLLTLDGPDHCGEVRVHDLGIDVQPGAGGVLDTSVFRAALKPRLRNSHKGMFGDAGIIGGACGMTGAALLAGRAAQKLGAGRVLVGMLDPAAPAVDMQQPEMMLRDPMDVLRQATALALGPGLGQSEAALQMLKRAATFPGPLLLDADALNLLATHPPVQTALTRRSTPTLLTPHPAEAARLLQCSTAEVQANRVGAACEMAQRFNAHAVLKGCGSVVADPAGKWWINLTGNAGMASGGMGDVLSGVATALLAQGVPACQALQAAVHLHGAAAEELSRQGCGPVGLVASETIDPARMIFNNWLSSGNPFRHPDLQKENGVR